MRPQKAGLLAVAAAIAVMFAGCGSSSDGADDADPAAPVPVTVTTAAPQPTTAPPQPAPAPAPATTQAPATGVSPRVADAVRALDTAAAAVPDGRPYDLERDDDDGERAWEIKVASGNDQPHELVVSADGRTILEHGREDRDDDTDAALGAQVPLTQALQTAAQRVGGRLDEAEIDRERGTIVWSVKFEESARDREHEVLVDATTGAVIEVDTDEDDD